MGELPPVEVKDPDPNKLTIAEAIAMLPDKAKIHVFRNTRLALIGALWSRSAVIKQIRRGGALRSGVIASAKGHRILSPHKYGSIFIETKPQTWEEEKLNADVKD